MVAKAPRVKRDHAQPPGPGWVAPLAPQANATTREGRVLLLDLAARALLAGQAPPPEAALYLGAAISRWLEHGGKLGSLERDYLGVSKPSSQITASVLWHRLREQR